MPQKIFVLDDCSLPYASGLRTSVPTQAQVDRPLRDIRSQGELHAGSCMPRNEIRDPRNGARAVEFLTLSIRDTNPTMPFPLPSMFRRLFPALPALSVGTERTCSAWNRHESIGMKRWPTWPDVTAVAKAPSVHLLLKKYCTVLKCRSCLVQQQ